MALVMLPCDLPWWPAVVKQLDKAALAKTSEDLIDAMQRLHDMCNISLDPEEDVQDADLFSMLGTFLDNELDLAEREQVFTKTIPRMVERAKALKSTKPPQGLHFSLQQQGDSVEYSYAFVSSLIANAFFSTYPKRTAKTHPTLRDFNFTNFFKHLHKNAQKAKLRSIFHYYNYLETEHAFDGRLIISRQVMTSKQWLTIEDWLESNVPLCPLTIRHEGRLERVEAESKVLQVCFVNAKIGGGVLDGDVTQETVHVATHPEMLAAILSVEALEDNEVLIIEGVRHMSRINDPRHKATFESISKPNVVTVCCIDPEDYSRLPLTQFEEDNILREMNKSLLGFRQRHVPSSPTDPIKAEPEAEVGLGSRRLSPIGESFSSTPPETEGEDRIFAAGNNSKTDKQPTRDERRRLENATLEARSRPNGKSMRPPSPHKVCKDASCTNRRNRFIVLGSSGEVLPVTRQLGQMSVYSSCNSQSTDSFHSAKETIDEEPDFCSELEEVYEQLSKWLDDPIVADESRELDARDRAVVRFAGSLLKRALSESFAGVPVQEGEPQPFIDANDVNQQHKLALAVRSLSLELARQKNRRQQSVSESEDVDCYEDASCEMVREAKDVQRRKLWAVTLTSEVFQTLIDDHTTVRLSTPPMFESEQTTSERETREASTLRVSELPRENSPQGGGLLPVATGNWGCGTRLKGDPQLKLVIQWLASSLAGTPRLIYYTSGNPNLSKLDTVSRVLIDRRWSVGDLAAATLRYAMQTIEEQAERRNNLFEEIIGMDKSSP
ncbi:hypothetical protein P5V15_013539 [Pogonomyrmex californicus]